MKRHTERLLACLCLLVAQVAMLGVAIVYGLGIKPRSWVVYFVAIVCSYALSAMVDSVRNEEEE